MRVSGAVVQIVTTGIARRARVSDSAAQVVYQIRAKRLRSVYAALQVVRQGSDGAMARDSYAALQVVWRTGAPDGTRQRAWTFDFDGHSFYVLDLGSSGTLVFDLLTGQWSKFETEGYGGWNFKNGFHWRDGKMVVGGADGEGRLLRMTPQSFLDEGWRPVVYEVTGLLQVQGVDFFRQYALRMVGSSGVLADSVTPVMNMQFSDDRGETWSSEFQITLTPNTRQRIEFRSLGAFTAPGRLFRIYDQGGIRYLATVEADIGGTDGRSPS